MNSEQCSIAPPVGYAYYCAKCKNEETDSTVAEILAKSMGLDLWKPKDEVTFDFPKGAEACQRAIDGADCVICQPPIGNDCSWELGYALGTGKPVYVIGDLDEGDWMTKIGVQYISADSITQTFRSGVDTSKCSGA